MNNTNLEHYVAPPQEVVNWEAEYSYIGDQAENFFRLFDWENVRPASVEEFQQWRFSVRSCTGSLDGQSIMIQVAGRQDRHDCLQVSVQEFQKHFAEAGGAIHLSVLAERTADQVSHVTTT